MSREPEVALVVSADPWVDAFHRHCADHGGARVRCLILDPAVALDEDFDVLVTGDRWPALTPQFVDALHQRGRRVLVVGDPDLAADPSRRVGVDGVVDRAHSPLDLVDAVQALLPSVSEAARAPGWSPPADRPAVATHPGTEPTSGRGKGAFVVVGGPWGAGSTEIAIALAAQSVQRGARAVLVDADQVTPSVAVRLGLPLEPNLCAAVDAAAFGPGAVPGSLFDLGDGWPVVLVGPPNRRAGAALSGADVLAVGEVLVRRFSLVVFDVSAGLGAVDDTDVRAAVAARATAVVAVGAANPVGMVRLVEWIAGVRALAETVPIHVVVNRAPAGRRRRAQLAGELQREARVAGLTFVPTDPRVDDAAWSATVVERGPFARSVQSLGRNLAVVGRRVDGE